MVLVVCLMVSMLDLNSNNPSLNPIEVYLGADVYVYNRFEKNEN